MSNTESARPEQEPAAPARWTHTGIDAPYRFDIRGLKYLETWQGVAYRAELLHPDRGVVGQIVNEGTGGRTMFRSYDETVFGDRDLAAFAARCRKDGEPLDQDFGAEWLLDDVITEAETAGWVAEMRRKGEFMVRSYAPRTTCPYRGGAHFVGPDRGAPIIYTKPVLSRTARESLAAELATTPDQLDEGEWWQMFNGEAWVPLLPEPALTAEQASARIDTLVKLFEATTEPNRFMNGERLDDQFFAFGWLSTGQFTLVEDEIMTVNPHIWCQCAQRAAVVRFELWSRDHGPTGSGTVHAAKSCRRLVTID